MTRDTTTIADLTLERYRLAELPADEASRIAHLAATDADVRARLDALAQSDAEIQRDHPGDWWTRALRERSARERPAARAGGVGSQRARLIAVACACALIAAALWLPGLLWRGGTPSAALPADGADRIKGELASLLLYRRAGSAGELLSDGDAVKRGDLIRVAYRCASRRYGVIVSIDGRGVVTQHLPLTGPAAAALQPGATTLLDRAYELDDAPRWERFFLVTGETAFDVRVVLDAARGAAAGAGGEPPVTLRLQGPLQQSTFLLRKIS